MVSHLQEFTAKKQKESVFIFKAGTQVIKTDID